MKIYIKLILIGLLMMAGCSKTDSITGVAFKDAPVTLIAGEEVDLTVKLYPDKRMNPMNWCFQVPIVLWQK